MSREKALEYYRNKNANRMNCAQAVIAAFKEKFGLSDDIVRLFASYGAGRAPGGECGACYAAKFMLKEKHPDEIQKCDEVFLSNAGSNKCREIRKLKKLPCTGCVEKAAEFIEKIPGG